MRTPVRSHRLGLLALGIAVVAASLGCGGDDDADDTDVPTATDDDGDSVATGSPPAPTTPADEDDGGSDEDAGGSLDCEALRPDVESVLIQWQIYAQLPLQDSVDDWATVLGDPAEFAAGVERLRVLGGDDVDASLDTFAAAAAIAERGVDGDASALADITELLGDDVASALALQFPVGQAFTDAGC